MAAYLSNCSPECAATKKILARRRLGRLGCVRIIGWKAGVPYCLACGMPYKWGEQPRYGEPNPLRLDVIFAPRSSREP